MALKKIKLGNLVEISESKNIDNKYGIDDVKGISIQKKFIETKADMEGVSLKPYLLVKPDDFAYVTVTSRNGEKITLAHNTTKDTYIVSSSYVVFRVVRKDILLSDYLFMYFNRPEFDRYSRFNSWGSARETFSWEDMCDIELELPSIEIQRKYVEIYKGMVDNQVAYETGLEDLKLVCDGYIEDLRRKMPCEEIGQYLTIRSELNTTLKYGNSFVVGVSQSKQIIPTKSDTKDNDISKFTIIYPNDFVYNPRNGIAIALNKETAIISWNNTAFFINDTNTLLPEYLMMWFSRKEWDRKVKIDSWGSSTEVYSFDSLKSTSIPIPNISIQKSIVNIYKVYRDRMEINDKLKQQIKNICPVLIKGAVEEESRYVKK